MGDFVNGRLLTVLAWVAAVAIMGLNGWLLAGTLRAWLF
jgi:Mn2+/Fe2+ NRAMP family transporter